jgi:hypothetical protein
MEQIWNTNRRMECMADSASTIQDNDEDMASQESSKLNTRDLEDPTFTLAAGDVFSSKNAPSLL